MREEELWQVIFCDSTAASDYTQSIHSVWGAGNGAFRLPVITGRKPYMTQMKVSVPLGLKGLYLFQIKIEHEESIFKTIKYFPVLHLPKRKLRSFEKKIFDYEKRQNGKFYSSLPSSSEQHGKRKNVLQY